MLQRQELRKAGLKVTLPRLKILEILEHNKLRHLSAEDIYKELLNTGEDIGLATVYRVLTQFESAGLVNRHNFEGGHSNNHCRTNIWKSLTSHGSGLSCC